MFEKTWNVHASLWKAGKLYSLHSNTLRVQMALWYIAASLILVAILIAILSVASLIFVFCFRHYNGPLACDYCCLWILGLLRWLRLKLPCCSSPSENSYHTVCIDNGEDYCSDDCSSGCCESTDSQCLGAPPGWQQYWHGTPCATV